MNGFPSKEGFQRGREIPKGEIFFTDRDRLAGCECRFGPPTHRTMLPWRGCRVGGARRAIHEARLQRSPEIWAFFSRLRRYSPGGLRGTCQQHFEIEEPAGTSGLADYGDAPRVLEDRARSLTLTATAESTGATWQWCSRPGECAQRTRIASRTSMAMATLMAAIWQ